MWKALNSYRDILYVAIPAAVWLFLRFWRRKADNEMQVYASSRGWQYRTQIDPAELDLYATSFFGRFDTAESVLSGVLDGTGFSHFVQRRASGHGHKADSREIVVFEIGDGTPDHGPTPCSDGFTIEVSNGRAFMWREQGDQDDDDMDDDEGLDQFLSRALAACQLAIREPAG
ncbi:MAG: hypothetical protein ACM3SW_02140 [Actinomycetota bacterium]